MSRDAWASPNFGRIRPESILAPPLLLMGGPPQIENLTYGPDDVGRLYLWHHVIIVASHQLSSQDIRKKKVFHGNM